MVVGVAFLGATVGLAVVGAVVGEPEFWEVIFSSPGDRCAARCHRIYLSIVHVFHE
jgi:hypothetical protein